MLSVKILFRKRKKNTIKEIHIFYKLKKYFRYFLSYDTSNHFPTTSYKKTHKLKQKYKQEKVTFVKPKIYNIG